MKLLQIPLLAGRDVPKARPFGKVSVRHIQRRPAGICLARPL